MGRERGVLGASPAEGGKGAFQSGSSSGIPGLWPLTLPPLLGCGICGCPAGGGRLTMHFTGVCISLHTMCSQKGITGKVQHLCATTGGSLGLARRTPMLTNNMVQVRCGLESPDSGTYQQRVGHMRLLGEMYNFRLVDSRYTLQAANCAIHCCVDCATTALHVPFYAGACQPVVSTSQPLCCSTVCWYDG